MFTFVANKEHICSRFLILSLLLTALFKFFQLPEHNNAESNDKEEPEKGGDTFAHSKN